MSRLDLEETVLDLAEEIERLDPQRRRIIARDSPAAGRNLQPLFGACSALVLAVGDRGLRLDEAIAGVMAAARAMRPTSRRVFVRRLLEPTTAWPEGLQHYFDLLARVVSAAGTDTKETE